MTSRNRQLSLEEPFEALPQSRPRRPPSEHNVLKTRGTAATDDVVSSTLTPALPMFNMRVGGDDDDRPPAISVNEVSRSTHTPTSIRVLNISRDGEAYPTAGPAPPPPSSRFELNISQRQQPETQSPSVPRYGRRSGEPHGSTAERRGQDDWTLAAPAASSANPGRLHLDLDTPAYPSRASRTPTAQSSLSHSREPGTNTPSVQQRSSATPTPTPTLDPHEAAVAALRLRERPSRTIARPAAPRTPSKRSSSRPGLPPRHLPTAQEKPWLRGLDGIVTSVWATLGFLGLPPAPPLRGGGASDFLAPVVTVEDQALFVTQLRYYFASGGRGLERVACTTASLGNALWYIIFNAVYYCVGVLGSAYAPVKGSDEDEETCGSEAGAQPREPPSAILTPLVWDGQQQQRTQAAGAAGALRRNSNSSGVPSSLGEQLRELARQVRPTSGPQRRAGGGGDTESSALSEGSASAWEAAAASEEIDPTLYSNAFTEALPFPTEDWFSVMRYMTCIGYQRDAFYLQTPADTCPQELVLALLWLTKRYQLLAVAECVELNVRFPFLLVHHSDPADDDAGKNAIDKPGERLLFAFPKSSVWPPASFDENQAIDRRLHTIQRLLGGSSEDAANAAKAGPSVLLRRLLAVRRQVDLSLGRVEKALHQRTDQVRFLGLHSALDAQLCLPEMDAAYSHLLAGLKHVRDTEERTKERVQDLSALGDLVAYALRHHRVTSIPSEAQVLDGLEEDAATWLAALQKDHPAPAPTGTRRRDTVCSQGALPPLKAGVLDAERLKTALSKFRATHTKQYLADLWRSLTRRAQMETGRPTASSASSPPARRGNKGGSDRPFAADPHAQRSHLGQVKRSLTTRYSFQAALATEVLLLQQGDVAEPVLTAAALAAALQPPLFSLDTLPIDLVCSAHERHQALRQTQGQTTDAAKDVAPLPAALYQLTEVGAPAASATTSARMELRRLSALLEQLKSDPERTARTRGGERAVATLHDVYRLRVAQTIKSGEATY